MSPFIVAEMSANHLRSYSIAESIILEAKWAGADAVKFQTWSPETMCIDPSYALTKGPWEGRSLVRLYRECHTPWEWHAPLFAMVRDLGMVPFSAAFDNASVDFLETLNVDRHKVASFELVDLPLIRYMASKGKPMILSTGMASEDEIANALDATETAGIESKDITLLKCTSAYPADAHDANLVTLKRLHWMVMPGQAGLSDHTLGIGVACAAVALGATYIEKHLTLSRADGGPDAGFSMEPHEFKQMVTECRRAAASIGEVKYGPGPNESTELRRSLWVSKDVRACEKFVLGANVVTARPALGLPCDFSLALGGVPLTARYDVKAGVPLTAECIYERVFA